MEYCPNDTSVWRVWVDHGFSLCPFDTFATLIVGTFILLLGLVEIRFYWKYATRHDHAVLPKNFLYRLQVACHVLLALSAVARFVFIHTFFRTKIYGFQIVEMVGACLVWPMCLIVLIIERQFQLPTSPGHGHGVILLVTWSLQFICHNLALLSLNNQEWYFHMTNLRENVEFGFFIFRYVVTCVTFFLGLKAPGISQTRDYFQTGDDREAILPGPSGGGNANSRRSASDGSTWRGLWRKMATLLPYMWPKKSLELQVRVLFCVVLLVAVRVVNVFVPIFYKYIVDALNPSGPGSEVAFCWHLILIFCALKSLQGGGAGNNGLLNNLRTFLWIRVKQYTTREVQVGLFRHLHALSLRWHLSRKTGEVLRVMDRGTNSINNLLSYLVFNVMPTMVDIGIAIIYFTAAFNVWFGLIVFVTMALYLSCTILTTEWRTKYRRSMNLADNEQRTKGVDSLLNFETVKYYGAEKYEIDRYEKAIVDYQKEEWKSEASLALLNTLQTFVNNGGLLAGALYCGYLVSKDQLTVGDYVLFGTYILQLMGPLNFLGTLYRVIQESFVNMENMLDLMSEAQEVQDKPDARPLAVTRGKIEFKDVTFCYGPDRNILSNVSFAAEPGETIALVGPTGAGKSTVIRLLFRFYDVQSGQVLIDGQDVKDVTQASVRKNIGVVPQDTVLFNDTIRYNIRYGRPLANDDEVESAAVHADIHDKISQSFPDGYDTKVGERGLKLSGGEKQRVAIARTLLKEPAVVLLDEATSALDTQTERNIQNSLNRICSGRTTIVVAHRLSTVTHADCILVLKDGQIIERGRHDELLSLGQTYASMWNQQSQKNGEKEEEGGEEKEDKEKEKEKEQE